MIGWACAALLVLWIGAREVQWRLTRSRRWWRFRLMLWDGRPAVGFELGSWNGFTYCGGIRRLFSLGREQ